MNSFLLLLLVLIFTIYLAIKTNAAQAKKHKINVQRHSDQFPDTSSQYVWKNYNPVTKEEFKDSFEKEGIIEKWSFFEKHLKPEIRIKPIQVDEDEINIGQSKFGGRPDLPESIMWPKQNNGKHLAFLSQINFSELSSSEIDIPNQGILYFFYSEDQEFWGSDKENAADYRTIFVSHPSDLKRRETPNSITKLRDKQHKPCKLEFTKSYSLPNWEHEFVGNQFRGLNNEPYSDISSSEGFQSKLFGHSINVQGTMEFECEMVERGYDWRNIPENEKENIKLNQYNWNLLFQLDSEPEAQMMWGDAGKLYFWIKEEHLKSHQYDKTWMILQCH